MRRPTLVEVISAVAILIVCLAAIGFIRDPFGWRKAKVERLEAEAEYSADDASARALEAEGAAAQAVQVEVLVRQPVATATAAAQPLIIDAWKAPDANAPLDPARADRLRALDRQLCDQKPGLAGCAAAAPGDPARGG